MTTTTNALARIPQRELRGNERKLYLKVRQALWDYEPLRASHAEILIQVVGRSVHLSGRTRTISGKIMAEVLVRRLSEVESVSSSIVADAETIRAVADALAEDPRTAPHVLRVESTHSIVSLMGQVPDEATRHAALEIASRVPEVAAVRDRLTVGVVAYAAYSVARASDPAVVLAGAWGASVVRPITPKQLPIG
jgi:osmotically-inducible protein OsmY